MIVYFPEDEHKPPIWVEVSHITMVMDLGDRLRMEFVNGMKLELHGNSAEILREVLRKESNKLTQSEVNRD